MSTMKRTDTELYETMAKAIGYMRKHEHEKVAPKDIARAVGMSESRFSHAFKEWVGLSPKRYLSHLSHERAKALLKDSRSVLAASYKAGLSGPGRLHALFVEHDGVSPGEYKLGEIKIRYGVVPSPFGACLIGTTTRGVCTLSFLTRGSDTEARATLKQAWPTAHLVRDETRIRRIAQTLFGKKGSTNIFPLVVRGTNFQIQVWKALLTIPEGHAATYADIARLIGRPKAVRAVGSACGKNRIGYIIPCHRVLTSSGTLGGYAWEPARKEVMLAWEAARKTRA